MKKVTVHSIASVSAGQGAPKKNEFSEQGTPFIRAGSLEDLLAGKSEAGFELVSEETAKKRKLKLYPKGSILFAKSGVSATKGRIYALQSPAYVVSHLAILIPNDKIHGEYLRLVLNQFPPSRLIKDSAYPAISLEEIKKYKIPVPEELDDQIRIAHLLGKVEGLIARRKQHLQQLDELLKSVFLEMFGDPVRNEKGWSECNLGVIIKIKHGFAFKSEFFQNSGPFVLLTPGNFFEKGGFRDRGDRQKYYVGETPQEYILNKGDLLIAMTEQAPGLLGSPLIVPESNLYLHNQRLGLVKAKKTIQPLFLFHLFNQKSIRKIIHSKATGAKVRHTSPAKIESIVIGYPPINLQNLFAAIVEKVETIKSQYQQSLAELENLYGALSQKAFKGELDLSRVPLVKKERDEQQGKESDVKAEEMTEEETRSIELPEPADLGSLAKTTGRRDALENWLASYLAQLGGKAFDVGQFMQQAQLKLDELIEDEPPELGVDEYDWIKERVFQLLENGQMTQDYDDDKNRVLIKGQGNSQS